METTMPRGETEFMTDRQYYSNTNTTILGTEEKGKYAKPFVESRDLSTVFSPISISSTGIKKCQHFKLALATHPQNFSHLISHFPQSASFKFVLPRLLTSYECQILEFKFLFV